MASRRPPWIPGLGSSVLAVALTALPLLAQTPTSPPPTTAAIPPATPLAQGQTPAAPKAPTEMTTTTDAPRGSLSGSATFLHISWVWEPAPPEEATHPEPPTTLPTWRYLLNRTAAGSTTQEMVDLTAGTCAAGDQLPPSPRPTPVPSGSTPGGATPTPLPAPATGTRYCAQLACPGPGAYVTLLQAVNQHGASEPSNVVSFGLDATCQRTTYDQALAVALSLERGEPTAPAPSPTAPPAGTPAPTPAPPVAGTAPGTGPASGSSGPQMEEPTTGPAVVEGSPPGQVPGQPTRPEPPDPLQPPGSPSGTLAERDEENIKTYEEAQATERKAYEAVLAKYTALTKQPGAKPADVQKAHEEVVKAYGEATKDIMESYRTALTTWSELLVEWQEEQEPASTTALPPTGNTLPSTTPGTTPGTPPGTTPGTPPGTTPETTPGSPSETTEVVPPEQVAETPPPSETPPAAARPPETPTTSSEGPLIATSASAFTAGGTFEMQRVRLRDGDEEIVIENGQPSTTAPTTPAAPHVMQPDGTTTAPAPGEAEKPPTADPKVQASPKTAENAPAGGMASRGQ